MSAYYPPLVSNGTYDPNYFNVSYFEEAQLQGGTTTTQQTNGLILSNTTLQTSTNITGSLTLNANTSSTASTLTIDGNGSNILSVANGNSTFSTVNIGNNNASNLASINISPASGGAVNIGNSSATSQTVNIKSPMVCGAVSCGALSCTSETDTGNLSSSGNQTFGTSSTNTMSIYSTPTIYTPFQIGYSSIPTLTSSNWLYFNTVNKSLTTMTANTSNTYNLTSFQFPAAGVYIISTAIYVVETAANSWLQFLDFCPINTLSNQINGAQLTQLNINNGSSQSTTNEPSYSYNGNSYSLFNVFTVSNASQTYYANYNCVSYNSSGSLANVFQIQFGLTYIRIA